jgi:enoyl-CoA hydratase/carnithine racemase
MAARLLQHREGELLFLTLSHPSKRNALHPDILSELCTLLTSPISSPPRAAVLSGGNSFFCAGYDIEALPSHDAADAILPDSLVEQTMEAVEAAPFPMVAAIEGGAFGAGFELACRCDLRVAVRGAKLALTPAKLGIVYSSRGLSRLLSLLGLSTTKELVLLGQPITAERAYELGFVHRLVDTPAECHAVAASLAKTLAQNAPLAVQGMKRVLTLLSQEQLSSEQISEIQTLRANAFASADAQEGRRAFFEKRPPKFEGK